MPPSPVPSTSQKIDPRVYLGILFFRWQIIALCFLYALLAGVIYIHLAPKLYSIRCSVLVYRDPKLRVTWEKGPWDALTAHMYLLRSEKLERRTVDRLRDQWGETIGSERRMKLPVNVAKTSSVGPTLVISTRSQHVKYAEAYLTVLLEEYQREWRSIQMEASDSASELLDQELVRLEERITEAENDAIEYQRLHDLARVEITGDEERAYLAGLVNRRRQLTTELMLLEAQYPKLKGMNATVINDIGNLTRETGRVEGSSVAESDREGAEKPAVPATTLPEGVRALPGPAEAPESALDAEARQREIGWHDLRVKLAQLESQERELAENLKPEHPQLRAVRKDIEQVKKQLAVGAEIEIGKMKDRYDALRIQLDAIENAEYKWQAKNYLAQQRQAEFARIKNVASRYQANYNTLYSRLHDMRVSEELEAEHIRVIEPVKAGEKPVWPDPLKILLTALIAGLGSGLGLAFVAQLLDNRIQSIKDVESELGVSFLGGVPFWVHSGLEKVIRPIVTEEHSTGAVEAYRAGDEAADLARDAHQRAGQAG